MTAIRKHMRDFVAILLLAAIGLATVWYILAQQNFRFPFFDDPPFQIAAELGHAQGVMPGQGQTVRVAGMRVGAVGGVRLADGRAVVDLDLEPEYDDLARRDASVLLRPRTGLRDMFIELDPGSDAEPPLEEGATIPIKNSAPDVTPDEMLAMLDDDTRDYLRLLINGAGGGLRGRGHDLREVFARLGPLHRDLARINGLIKERRRNLARLIHNSGETFEELAEKDEELSQLVVNSERVFGALASQDQNISDAVSQLPSTLAQAERTLGRVDELGQEIGPTFEAMRPVARQLLPTNRALRPFAEQAMPIVRDQIRPFVRAARPFVRDIGPAARDLHHASPDLRASFFQLNRLFNMLAYNPNGAEEISENCERTDLTCTPEEMARDEGYLFWLAWVAQNSVSTFSTGDAQGPFRRFLASASCTTIRGLVQEEPALELLLGVTDLLGDSDLCPPSD